MYQYWKQIISRMLQLQLELLIQLLIWSSDSNSGMNQNYLLTVKFVLNLTELVQCSRGVQVKLMRQLRDEAQKSRQSEQKSRKTIAQLQKQHQAKESKIKSLEAEKNKKEVILKRKMEEVLYRFKSWSQVIILDALLTLPMQVQLFCIAVGELLRNYFFAWS